ncbi:hypothetical protein [Candidatus Nitrosotenuis sp. DW1]|uniref:hypothetical protein n=1 Tax=Candidatus Nitrosotenuis sp. DW1 TaxID=2259672 RepID=UPI0015C7DF06|nr:hypothetical protein [Candidatus Nitrosotenuis sp. DW1]QLH09668.1 hypothetical protein DSQ19_09520 [Candidatus Nitrosotenuis sp. DW1]
MRISPLRIGLVLAAIGIVAIVVIFDSNQKIISSVTLEREETSSVNLNLRDGGIGYYKIMIPDFDGQLIFVQIEDDVGNVISDKKIETKMSVNYFDFQSGGKYTLKITNISEKPTSLQVEFGNTDVSALRIPAIILGIGVVLILFSVYKRLRNYSTAQPDENIS